MRTVFSKKILIVTCAFLFLIFLAGSRPSPVQAHNAAAGNCTHANNDWTDCWEEDYCSAGDIVNDGTRCFTSPTYEGALAQCNVGETPYDELIGSTTYWHCGCGSIPPSAGGPTATHVTDGCSVQLTPSCTTSPNLTATWKYAPYSTSLRTIGANSCTAYIQAGTCTYTISNSCNQTTQSNITTLGSCGAIQDGGAYRLVINRLYSDPLQSGIITVNCPSAPAPADPAPADPAPPGTLSAPTNLIGDCGNIARQLTLGWTGVIRAASYSLRVRKVSDSSIIINNRNIGDVTAYITPTTDSIIPGQSYDWWVRAVDSSGTSGTEASGIPIICAPLIEPPSPPPIPASCTTMSLVYNTGGNPPVVSPISLTSTGTTSRTRTILVRGVNTAVTECDGTRPLEEITWEKGIMLDATTWGLILPTDNRFNIISLNPQGTSCLDSVLDKLTGNAGNIWAGSATGTVTVKITDPGRGNAGDPNYCPSQSRYITVGVIAPVVVPPPGGTPSPPVDPPPPPPPGAPPETYSIQGYVYVDSNNNGTKELSESCLDGDITVQLGPPAGVALPSGLVTTPTYRQQADCTPIYNFDNLPAGTYTVTIQGVPSNQDLLEPRSYRIRVP